MTHLKWMWLSLVIFTDIVGVLVGLSFATPGFFLDPTAALFCFFANITLGVTMWKLDQQRHNKLITDTENIRERGYGSVYRHALEIKQDAVKIVKGIGT